MKKNTPFPNYLAAIDEKRRRIFVLSVPDLCAVCIQGEWQYCEPLSDQEIQNHYELVTDLPKALKLVNEAKAALSPFPAN